MRKNNSSNIHSHLHRLTFPTKIVFTRSSRIRQTYCNLLNIGTMGFWPAIYYLNKRCHLLAFNFTLFSMTRGWQFLRLLRGEYGPFPLYLRATQGGLSLIVLVLRFQISILLHFLYQSSVFVFCFIFWKKLIINLLLHFSFKYSFYDIWKNNAKADFWLH